MTCGLASRASFLFHFLPQLPLMECHHAFDCKMPVVPLRRLRRMGGAGWRTDLIGGRVELSGKVALVTGSSRGIGREISRVLAAKGARVAVHYRADREAAQETLASLGGGPHAVFGAD